MPREFHRLESSSRSFDEDPQLRAVVVLNAVAAKPLRLFLEQFTDRFSLFSVAEQVDPRTAAGRLVLNILTTIGQWEREVIGERTAEALQHMMTAEGARLGGEALGWTRVEDLDEHGRRRWVEAKDEAETVQRILELHREGDSFSGIARKLEAEGHRTKRGGRWTHKQVGRVIRRAQAA